MTGIKKFEFDSKKTETWVRFMDESIKRDNRSKPPKPHGWHWFWGLYYLQSHFPQNIPPFNFKKILNIFPDGHWLKIEEQENFIETILGTVRYEKPANRAKKHRLVKEWVKSFTIVGKITEINFSDISFNEFKNFSNFVFLLDTDFRNTKFSKDILFENAVFYEDVNFENARFHEKPKTYKETAKFKNAVFMNTADFSETVFNAYANFKGATFGGRTIFQLASFKYHAPRFYGATFNNEIILNRIKLPDAKKDEKNKNDRKAGLYEKRVEENKSAYETLIHLMEKQNKHHERHRFFREEMRWRQLGNKLTQKRLKDDSRKAIDAKYPKWGRTRNCLTCILFCFYNTLTCCSCKKQDVNYFIWRRIENRFTIIFFWFYDTSSEYGHGIGRAFGWWFLHIIVGFVLIAFIASGQGLGTWQVIFCSASTSFANANPFVFFGFKEGALMECYECLHDLSPLRFGTIRGLQTLIGIPLLFILLTTLRVRFRIK